MSPLTKDQASAIVGRFKGLSILVLGDLMIDEYLWGKVTRISPEAPIPVVEVTKDEFKPGGAANVGRNLLALGAKVFFAGVVGDDADGRKLCDAIRAQGGDVSGIVSDPSRPTTIKTRVLAQHQQVVRIDREKTFPVSGQVAERLLAQVLPLVDKVDGIILSDYDKGLLCRDLVQAIIARAKGKVIAVDPKPQNISLFAGTTFITPNKKEAELASGIALKNEAEVEKAARKLQETLSLEAVLITRGEEGMTLFAENRFWHVPTQAKQVFDVTGAGDTVISVATLVRCAGASMADATLLSNVAAGISVAHVGVYAVSPEEILAALG